MKPTFDTANNEVSIKLTKNAENNLLKRRALNGGRASRAESEIAEVIRNLRRPKKDKGKRGSSYFNRGAT